MKVVMLKDVKGVGQRGTVIDVADGYALNALIPSGKAVQATPEKLAEVQKQMQSASLEKAKHDAELATKIRALDTKSIEMAVKANEKGHLFKAIKKSDVAAKLGVEESMIAGIDEVVKSAGAYALTIAGAGASAQVTLLVKAA